MTTLVSAVVYAIDFHSLAGRLLWLVANGLSFVGLIPVYCSDDKL